MTLLVLPPPGEAFDRGQWSRALAQSHRVARELIRSEHQAGLDGLEVMARLTRLMDELLGAVWERVTAELAREGVGKEQRVVLLGLGSYGRRELAPHSDVDLLFLLPDRVGPWAAALTERILYLLWDLGLDVGYGTRTLRENSHLAIANPDVLTSLLDARFLQGDAHLLEEMRRDLTRKVLPRVRSEFVRGKLAEMEQRMSRHGGTVYVLEPSVKEGIGGLRDIQTVQWVAKVLFGCEGIAAFPEHGLADERDARHLARSRDFLLRTRLELHFAGSAARDILSMERQPQLADRFGYRDKEGVRGVERFMQVYYTHCATVRQITEAVIKRALEGERKVPRILDRLREKELGEGFFARDGAIHSREAPLARFRRSPGSLLGLFALYQRTNLELSPELQVAVRRSLRLVDDAFRRESANRAAFLAILGEERRLYETLLLMNELRLLGRFLPEFDRIHCKMQHDYYHAYTVDEHSIRSVHEIVALPRTEEPHLELLRQAARETGEAGDRTLLLLAVLLHDVGKGYGPGHAERGGRLAVEIADRLGLEEEEGDTLQFLIRHHLAMAHVAQRRDLHDERTIAEFASLAGSLPRLRLLLLLTYADIKAVGPGVWSEWKGSLLSELFTETARHLAAGGVLPAETEGKVRERREETARLLGGRYPGEWVETELDRLSARAYLTYRPEKLAQLLTVLGGRGEEALATGWRQEERMGFTELSVVAADAPGLFAKIAGVLTANGINILAAQIYTRDDGTVFDVLQVTDSVMSPVIDPVKQRIVSMELSRAAAGEVAVEDLLRSRRLSMPLDRRDRAAAAPDRVEVDNDASDRFTVIDVYARDRIGLLWSITSTLATLGLSIHNAKVSTKVDQAVDVFYVTSLAGEKVTDPRHIEEVRQGLLRALEEPAGRRTDGETG